MEEKNELPELFLIFGQSLRVESLKGPFVGPFVVEPSLPNRRDEYPATPQIDRIIVSLINRRDFPAPEWTIERVFRPLPLKQSDIPIGRRPKLSQDRVGILPVGLDVFLTGNRVTLRVVNRPGVPEQLAEHVVEKVDKKFLFLMEIDRAGGNDLSPLLQLWDKLR